MSRLARSEYEGNGVAVEVVTDTLNGPVSVDGASVLQRLEYYREWIGILAGKPQRDVWLVETERGICEVHYLSYPKADADSGEGTWLLMRWED